MFDTQLFEMYSKYLPYNVKTDKGILCGLINGDKALTENDNGEITEYHIQDIKLHLNPIEKLIDEVDEMYGTKITPILELAIIGEGGPIWVPKVKGFFDGDHYICGVRYRNHLNEFKALTFSSKNGFLTFSTTEEDVKEERKIIQTKHTQHMYETLFELHINLYDTNMYYSAYLDKSRYIIKENINTQYRETQVGIDL